MNNLKSKDLIAPYSRRDLLGNSLVLVTHGEAAPIEIGLPSTSRLS